MEISKNSYKYAHIFTVDSFLYNKSIQKLICENYLSDEHIFIYLNEKSYSLVKDLKLGKTILENSSCTVELIRKALEIADIVFIHNNGFSNTEIVKLTDAEANRLIWSVWGPDLYKNDNLRKKRNVFYKILRFVYHLLRYKHVYTQNTISRQVAEADLKINKFRAICAGFEGDIVEIKKRYPDVTVFQALYPGESSLHNIIPWENEVVNDSHQKVRILLGHCALKFLQHKKWLKKLASEKDSIELYIPLNYGNKKYADKIEKLAKRLFGTSVICFKTPLTPKDYFIQVLAKVDMAIFDFEIQSAYGNALLLLYLGKKIFYPENSVMYKGLSENGACVFKLEEFDVRSFSNKFNNNNKTEESIEFARKRLDINTYVNQWKSVFDFRRESE